MTDETPCWTETGSELFLALGRIITASWDEHFRDRGLKPWLRRRGRLVGQTLAVAIS